MPCFIKFAILSFLSLIAESLHLEWLQLQRTGHQRAQFDYVHQDWEKRWIVP